MSKMVMEGLARILVAVKKSLLIYGAVLCIFGVGILLTLQFGRSLTPRSDSTARGLRAGQSSVSPSAEPRSWVDSILSGVPANLREPVARLFLQLLVILLATRIVGGAFVKIGQPSVVGEMFAGILLGPSMFGPLFPQGYEFVFPDDSLDSLKLLSQIGVCLFLFSVGMELDLTRLRGKAQTAIVVSHAGILVPYFLGVVASLALFSPLAGPGISFEPFALFMGISMSITAFPVLARILQERALEKTDLGITAITCAAVDDVTAWSILAVIIAVVKSVAVAASLLTLALVLVFVAAMLLIVRPQLSRWFESLPPAQGNLGRGQIAGVLAFAFASSLTTEVIGVHVMFGAFLAGVVMPKGIEFRNYLKVRIESFSSIFLLPLFFAFTGLRTRMGLIDDAEGWWLCGIIIAVATVGKLVSSMLAARLAGMKWNESFAFGALMNTRGLMELVAVNIGYDLKILSPKIFAMLVLMALVTTFMTGPLLTMARLAKTSVEMPPV